VSLRLDLRADDVVPLLEPGVGSTGGGRIGAVRTTGSVHGRTDGSVAWVILESGQGYLRVAGEETHVEGRDDVFAGPGWSGLVPPGEEFVIHGDDTIAATIRLVHVDARRRPSAPHRPGHRHRGAPRRRHDGATRAHVRRPWAADRGGDAQPAGRVVELAAAPPRSRGDLPLPLRPAHGFGIHAGFDDGGDNPVIVRDGDIERITTGWHPVVAAPGFTMYYLWALAGDEDSVDTQTHPAFS
jgi:5-deoxy-glucuronate isomerase